MENLATMTLRDVIDHPHRDRLAIRPVKGSIAFFELSSIEEAKDKYLVGFGMRYPRGISHHRGGVFVAAASDEMGVVVIGGNPDGTWFVPELHRDELLGHRLNRGGRGTMHIQRIEMAGPLAYGSRNICGSSMGVVHPLTLIENPDYTDEAACRSHIASAVSLIADPDAALESASCQRCAYSYSRLIARARP